MLVSLVSDSERDRWLRSAVQNGNLFLLPPKYLERLRAAPDSVVSCLYFVFRVLCLPGVYFDQVAAINEVFQIKYTVDEFQLHPPYQTNVVRTDATRAIPTFIPEVRAESTLAISEALKPVSGKGAVSLNL